MYNGFLDLFTLELSGRLNWRTIDRDTRYRSLDDQSQNIFDTKIEELGIGAESSLRYRAETINGALRLNYFERDEVDILTFFSFLLKTTTIPPFESPLPMLHTYP